MVASWSLHSLLATPQVLLRLRVLCGITLPVQLGLGASGPVRRDSHSGAAPQQAPAPRARAAARRKSPLPPRARVTRVRRAGHALRPEAARGRAGEGEGGAAGQALGGRQRHGQPREAAPGAPPQRGRRAQRASGRAASLAPTIGCLGAKHECAKTIIRTMSCSGAKAYLADLTMCWPVAQAAQADADAARQDAERQAADVARLTQQRDSDWRVRRRGGRRVVACVTLSLYALCPYARRLMRRDADASRVPWRGSVAEPSTHLVHVLCRGCLPSGAPAFAGR